MQALILAGGEGTRLRPLTSTIPKPVVPLVDRPFIVYMLEWLRSHGIDDAILSCGFMADGVRDVLGDGTSLGIRLRYVEEPEPLGTGGALKYAEALLEERFFMLNGDVLTDIDLTAQLAQHEETGARGTLALIGVQDPSAYGLVRRHPSGAVRQFLEKPSAEEIDTNLISAGAYILQRDVLDGMGPTGSRISIERDVFPTLVGNGLFGYEASGYWLDIGTPGRYLEATYDILHGLVHTEVGRRVSEAHGVLRLADDRDVNVDGDRDGDGHDGDAAVHPPCVIGAGCTMSPDATIGGRTVLGRDVTVGPGAHVEASVLLDGVTVGAGTRITSSILCRGVSVAENCRIQDGVVLGEGVRIGAGNRLQAGVRIFPGVELSGGAIAF